MRKGGIFSCTRARAQIETHATATKTTAKMEKVIISMHGAGLANLLWARQGTVVVEIFPRNKRRYGYEHLSA